MTDGRTGKEDPKERWVSSQIVEDLLRLEEEQKG